jgi:glycosyltransferase involved in cell wall biosynthesis
VAEPAPALRVAFLSPEWPPERAANGIVSYVAAMREGLEVHGVASRVVSSAVPPDARTPEVVDLDDADPQPRCVRLRQRLLARVRPDLAASLAAGRELESTLRALQRSWPFDLFEAEESWGIAARAARLAGFPTLVRLHGPWFLNGPANGARRGARFAERDVRERRLLAAAFAVSAPSRDVLERARRHFRLPLEGARVIPNPVRDVAPALRWKPRPERPPCILFVGRFDRHKGGDLAIDAFRELGAALPRAELLFVGPDPGFVDERGRRLGLDEYLTERIPDADVRCRVRRLGALPPPEIAALRQRASVVVVPSRYEVFAMTAMEALASAAPLVAADVGGLGEMLRSGEDALCFAAGDARDLARRVRELLDRPELAARISAGGRRLFERRCAPAAVAAEALAFYGEVALRHRARARGRAPAAP